MRDFSLRMIALMGQAAALLVFFSKAYCVTVLTVTWLSATFQAKGARKRKNAEMMNDDGSCLFFCGSFCCLSFFLFLSVATGDFTPCV